jgi:hypothetical protein
VEALFEGVVLATVLAIERDVSQKPFEGSGFEVTLVGLAASTAVTYRGTGKLAKAL